MDSHLKPQPHEAPTRPTGSGRPTASTATAAQRARSDAGGGPTSPEAMPHRGDAGSATARGTRSPSALPQRIALVNASIHPAASAEHCLLGDFADALFAYEDISARQLGEAPHHLDVAWFSLADTGEPRAFALATAGAVDDAGRRARDGSAKPNCPGNAASTAWPLCSCDTIVLAFPLGGAHHLASAPEAFAHLLAGGAVAPGTRLYAIGRTNGYEPEQLLPSFTRLAAICRNHGIAWCGGLAIGGGDLIVPTAHAPRMGLLRRTRSEGTDRLIAAVRSGIPLRDLIGQDSEPHVLARCPLPRWLYPVAVAVAQRSGTRKKR